jgi:formylmethanofuran dehydrogenase subunit E
MNEHDILLDALKFHGHCCWASVAVERYTRIKNGQIVCMPCAEKN